jgi:hypothetical protein
MKVLIHAGGLCCYKPTWPSKPHVTQSYRFHMTFGEMHPDQATRKRDKFIQAMACSHSCFINANLNRNIR